MPVLEFEYGDGSEGAVRFIFHENGVLEFELDVGIDKIKNAIIDEEESVCIGTELTPKEAHILSGAIMTNLNNKVNERDAAIESLIEATNGKITVC